MGYLPLIAILFIIIVIVTLHIILSSSVKKHSALFIEIMEVNKKYKLLFRGILSIYHVDYVCSSYKQLKNRNNIDTMTNYLCGLAKEQGSIVNIAYEGTEKNKDYIGDYQSEFATVMSRFAGSSYEKVKRSTILSEEQFNNLELRMCNRRRLKPKTDTNVVCKVIYITPKKTKTYSAQRLIPMNSIASRIKERTEAEQSIAYQRSLMTSSKRYDIMKRDGFKCKLCGISADEGAKLEVDHILAVSRGGKSTDNNLRTLCRECNQGKKAKIE